MTVKTNKLNCLCFSCKVCSKFLHGCLLCANHSWYLEAQTFYLTLFTLSSSFTGQHPSSVSLDTRAVVFYMILEYLSVKEGTTAFRVPPMKLPLCILVGRATKGAYVWSRACNSPCPTLTGSHVSLSKEDRSSPWAVPAEVSFLAPVVFFFSGFSASSSCPTLSPAKEPGLLEGSWENLWHVPSVHAGRKCLWTVSAAAVVTSLGRKGLEAGI